MSVTGCTPREICDHHALGACVPELALFVPGKQTNKQTFQIPQPLSALRAAPKQFHPRDTCVSSVDAAQGSSRTCSLYVVTPSPVRPLHLQSVAQRSAPASPVQAPAGTRSEPQSLSSRTQSPLGLGVSDRAVLDF